MSQDANRPPEPSKGAREAMDVLGADKPITKARRAALHAEAVNQARWLSKHHPEAYRELVGVMKAVLGAGK